MDKNEVKAVGENRRHPFQPNFDPEESLKRMQKEPTPENERRFFSEIKNARFLVPCVPRSGQPAARNYPAVLGTQKGEHFLPAFTDTGELGKWPYIIRKVSVFTFDDLKHTILEHPQNLAGIAINPFGKVLLLRQNQIAQIDAATRGMSVQRVNHEGKLRLSRPKGIPPGLISSLKAFFSQRREVRLVYLLLAQGPEEPAPHWLFLIDFDGTESGLFPQVAEAVQPYMKQGESFELLKATAQFLQFASTRAELIYGPRPGRALH